MRFTDRELDRMIEFIQWGIDKGVKDSDLKSALDKLVRMKGNTYDDFGYLNYVSKEAKQFVIDRVNAGNKNVYHSIMATLGNRIQHNTIKPFEEEYAFYLQKAKKHDFTESELPYVREIFEYCYTKGLEK